MLLEIKMVKYKSIDILKLIAYDLFVDLEILIQELGNFIIDFGVFMQILP